MYRSTDDLNVSKTCCRRDLDEGILFACLYLIVCAVMHDLSLFSLFLLFQMQSWTVIQPNCLEKLVRMSALSAVSVALHPRHLTSHGVDLPWLIC